MAKQKSRKFTNHALVVLGLISALSGVIIQIGYHIGVQDTVVKYTKTMLGLIYTDWQLIHKVSISTFFILCIYHIWIHRKWYVTVISKRLYRKNRQLILFSVVFLFSLVTGFVPWIIGNCGGNEVARVMLIEIHDKISIILIVFMFLHIMKRIKRL